jgi:hypothetical protein
MNQLLILLELKYLMLHYAYQTAQISSQRISQEPETA